MAIKCFKMLECHDETDSSSFFEKLSQNDLVITWDLPELHTVSKQVVRLPDRNVKNRIEELGLAWKTGHFSPDEDKIIVKNWNRLCKTFDLPNDPQSFAKWRNKAHNKDLSRVKQFAVLWLSKKLNDRMPSQVFQRFMHTLGSKNKGRFSTEETEIIEAFLLEKDAYTQQYLGSILNRDERSIWRRLTLIKQKKLLNGTPSKKLVWNIKLQQKLYYCITSVVNENGDRSNLDNLCNKPISWNQWILIANKMSISPLSAKTQWLQKLHVQLFATKKIYKHTTLLKLLKILKKKNYKHWVDVDWKKISKKFPGYTPIFLWKIYYHFARKKCPDFMKTFHETVEILNDRYVVKDNYIKRFLLKRIILNKKQKFAFHPEDE